ncbi:Protein of unknown function [Cotesia congregata]|nr:Protein of unknown function [Cotesia congregata]
MARKNMELNTKSAKTRAENWFSPSGGSLDSSNDINVSDSLISLLRQEQPPVENNVIVESTNGELLLIDDVQGQETSYETTSKLPLSPAKFIADDYFKLGVKDAIKSALPEVINELIVDIARDFLRRHAENKLVLKSESVSVGF